MQDTTDLLDFAKSVAREAGVIMLKYFDTDDKDIQTKADASPVTIADKLINQLVLDKVAEKYPEHGVLAEEGSQHEDRNQLWVCDPIDGTKGFIQHIPTALFSLAFVVDGSSEIAVLFDPFQDKLYSAARGKGASMNEVVLTVSAQPTLAGALVSLSGSYKELKARQPFFDSLVDHKAEIVMVPGNVFRSTLVATSGVDAHIFPGKSAHDIAASKLIIEEAGGKVTDLYGKEQRYDGKIYGAIITNGHIHDEVVELLAAFGPENFVGY
jgi:fructose-1,6-bisphosphatase/inositol monophosphatase family enzyme